MKTEKRARAHLAEVRAVHRFSINVDFLTHSLHPETETSEERVWRQFGEKRKLEAGQPVRESGQEGDSAKEELEHIASKV